MTIGTTFFLHIYSIRSYVSLVYWKLLRVIETFAKLYQNLQVDLINL